MCSSLGPAICKGAGYMPLVTKIVVLGFKKLIL